MRRMCFTAVIKAMKGNLGKKGLGAVWSTLPFIPKNPHGFGVRVDDNEPFRTLNQEEAKSFLLQISPDAQRVHLHYRLASTGEVSVANVHLWTRDGWSFSHNGMASGGSKEKSDSLELFESVKDWNFDSFTDAISKKGKWGVYIASGPNNEEFLASQGKTLKVMVADNLLIAASDGFEIGKFVEMEMPETIEVWGLKFTRTRKVRVRTTPLHPWKAEIENMAIHIKGSKLVEKAPIERPVTYANGYHYPYYYYGKGSIWE